MTSPQRHSGRRIVMWTALGIVGVLAATDGDDIDPRCRPQVLS